MKEVIVYCDICGKDIETDAHMIEIGTAARGTEPGIVKMLPQSLVARSNKLREMDFCEKCMGAIADMLIDLKETLAAVKNNSL